MKSWSKMQSVFAKSSGEAEYYSLGKGVAEAMGIRSMAADLGWDVSLIVWLDSSAAKSMASRTGLGKTRHMDVQYLWLQDVSRLPWVTLKKIPGDVNPSDILTKVRNRTDMANFVRKLNVFF